MIFAIASIELTLQWNAVTDVYGVDSTGQIIPLMVGAASLITVAWKLVWQHKSIVVGPRNERLSL